MRRICTSRSSGSDPRSSGGKASRSIRFSYSPKSKSSPAVRARRLPELDVPGGAAGHEKSPTAPHLSVRTTARLYAGHLWIPAATAQNLSWSTPRPRIVEGWCERDVNPFVRERFVPGAIEQHHISLQRRIPMERRPPKGVRGRLAVLPRARRSQHRRPSGIVPFNRDLVGPGERPRSGRKPHAILPDRDPSLGRVAIRPREARHAHALRARIASVVAEIQIQILPIAIDHHADVADAADHVAIRR